MRNEILHYFNASQFKRYREEQESIGKHFYSFAEVLNDSTLSDMGDDGIVDLTSFLACIKNGRDEYVYMFEQIINHVSKLPMFIIDEKLIEFAMHNLRYVFSFSEKIVVDVTSNELHNGSPNLLSNNADLYTLVSTKITDLSESELKSFHSEFEAKLYGHLDFKKHFRELTEVFRVFNKIGEHKILSLFLMGDSGIGKTEVARVLHKCLKGTKKLAKISFGNYSSKDALNSLIGSPLGYIGSDGGELMKRVKDSDTGIILIDEFEKADTPVFNYFLDVLENGKLVNTQAEEYDASGYIIVFTSNIRKDTFMKNISPELRSRFDYKGNFAYLSDEDKKKFALYRINEISEKFLKDGTKKITKKQKSDILNRIEYQNHKNMRDLNNTIKTEFVNYIMGRTKKESQTNET